MTGVEFLAKVYESWPNTIRIVLSGYADTAAIVEAINLGQIYKFIHKPWNDEEFKTAVSTALQHQELQEQNTRLNDDLQQTNQQLQEMNEKLEQLVQERTAALEIRNRVLQVSQGVLDVLSVAVFGVDSEGLIVQCNDRAQDLFPHGIMGPLGHHRDEVFPDQVNALFVHLETEENPCLKLELQGEQFLVSIKRMLKPFEQGIVMELIPIKAAGGASG